MRESRNTLKEPEVLMRRLFCANTRVLSRLEVKGEIFGRRTCYVSRWVMNDYNSENKTEKCWRSQKKMEDMRLRCVRVFWMRRMDGWMRGLRLRQRRRPGREWCFSLHFDADASISFNLLLSSLAVKQISATKRNGNNTPIKKRREKKEMLVRLYCSFRRAI